MRSHVTALVALATGAGCASSSTQAAVRHDVVAQLDAARPRPTERATPATCRDIVDAGLADHPRLRAIDARARAALDRADSAGALPPPRLSAEVWGFPIGDLASADRQGMYMVGVTQQLPPAGMREAGARAELEGARATVAELARAARQLRAELAHACTGWSAAVGVEQQLGAHRALLDELRTAVSARYRTGADTLATVARAEAEVAAADRHLAEATAEATAARRTLGALVGPRVPLPDAPPSLGEPTLTIGVEAIAAPPQRAELVAADARRRGAEAALDAAESDANVPTFELRATYMQMPSASPAAGAMFAMTLPWLWGGAPERARAAEREVEASAAERDDAERQVLAEIARARGMLEALTAAYAVLQQREIPAARTAIEAERAVLGAGAFDVQRWLDAAHALREAHVDEARIRGAIAHAQIDVEASLATITVGGEP